ncbi:hypothetical protein D9758_011960 [Tetrapyrgos nigripes]|uniref:Uncharacterized protein n=1 Tax=Tetrapyrgos nigripes TaxID=182062 RepID=A0A8H5D2I2_9AGAR|nr:hypothetical protein D9758_011960 [Tetrapyrgos nigripes]
MTRGPTNTHNKRVSIDDRKGQDVRVRRDVEASSSGHNVPSQIQPQIEGVPLDGGRTAWLTILGCWMVQFCTIGYSNAFGVYQDFYTRVYLTTKSPSDISWIGSFALFMQYAPGVFVGHAFDAGYFHHMMALGTCFQVFSMFMLSLAHQEQYYQVFLAQAVGIGFGMGLIFIPSLTIISQHFRKRRAFATGIAVTGASVGGIVWPIMLNHLIQITSFANAVRATGAVAGAMLLLANFIMKPTKPTKSTKGLGLIPRRFGFGDGHEQQPEQEKVQAQAEGAGRQRGSDSEGSGDSGCVSGSGLTSGPSPNSALESCQSHTRVGRRRFSIISNASLVPGFKMGFGTSPGPGLKDILSDAPFVVSIAA